MDIITLSDEFFSKYQHCNEILQKRQRPYLCLSIEIDGIHFAIPFRHHIAHKYCFLTCGQAGLDYTKAVVIYDQSFVANIGVHVEQGEFNAIKSKEPRIHNGMASYLKLYKKALNHQDNPHYSNILRCSSLQYFHAYLKL